MVLPPSRWNSRAASSPFSTLRHAPTTVKPWADSCWAVTLPRPVFAPVMTTTCPVPALQETPTRDVLPPASRLRATRRWTHTRVVARIMC